MPQKYLTKSDFLIAQTCPNKLYFARKKSYKNSLHDDSFLNYLSQEGYQVESLARAMYHKGVCIGNDFTDYESTSKRTKEMLTNQEITLFGASFLHQGLYAVSDIILKKDNCLEIIEVKAKSFSPPTDGQPFITKTGKIIKEWKSYLFDVAFQAYLVKKCFPEKNVLSSLMVVDPSKKTTVNNLNQMFSKEARTDVDIINPSFENNAHKKDIGDPILCKVPVDNIVDDILSGKIPCLEELSFEDTIHCIQEKYSRDEYFNYPMSYTHCKNCEFVASKKEKSRGILSGRDTCLSKQKGWSKEDCNEPTIFDIWGFKKTKIFDEGKLFMKDITKEDIDYKPSHHSLSTSHRQWLQIEKSIQGDTSIYVNKTMLCKEIELWKFPHHFIDFETCFPAIPFTRGSSPYDAIAFQFSHHIVTQKGEIVHKSQFILAEPGSFPNFEFIRTLKKNLETDTGTIFTYASHENTILNKIREQLLNSKEYDKRELVEFIESISTSSKKERTPWKGQRALTDLLKIVRKYYYNPYTGGSNSIKSVLPAALIKSEFLKNKYAHSIKDIDVTSLNFEETHVWLTKKHGEVVNPYDLLAPISTDASTEDSDPKNAVKTGTGALNAYVNLQDSGISKKQRISLEASLLKYCELDTLAMVMIYEHFLEIAQTA